MPWALHKPLKSCAGGSILLTFRLTPCFEVLLHIKMFLLFFLNYLFEASPLPLSHGHAKYFVAVGSGKINMLIDGATAVEHV